MRYRIDGDLQISEYGYGDGFEKNGVRFEFFSAGHVLGSAQVRVSYEGESWINTGDYKVENDGVSGDFTPTTCDHFITECTFGLPLFRWKPQAEVFAEINAWWAANAAAGELSIIYSYSLGKAQRVLHGLDTSIGPIYAHYTVEQINAIYKRHGATLPQTQSLTDLTAKTADPRGIIVAPPGLQDGKQVKALKVKHDAMASGWMAIRGIRRRRSYDKGFVLSDHADWPGLQEAIASSGASCIYPVHGYTEIFTRYLIDQGFDARDFHLDLERTT